ncbi:MAG TPA: homoserine O-acetyltransferase [Gemmatimonadales bacterium]|nr:homoserine O-acetyltransferase [Gemmatimonadales bacterium]
MIIDKKVFELPRYTTRNGAVIEKLRVGWESYGTLNRDRSNAILVTHYFSGTSHAAGRYSHQDELPGYWDAIIGPGKPIDTDKYFVFSSDTLVNLNARDPKVITTGPASCNPATRQPYRMGFPVVSIHDFVDVQKALVESLGISRLRAVIGPSMGALQAYQWAESYPEMVDRIVPVIGAAGGDPFLIAWLDVWSLPVRLDPKWRGGDYPEGDPPVAGMTAALKTITLHAQQADWARSTFGKAPAEVGKDPAQALANRFKIEEDLQAFASARAVSADANTFLYLIRANQLASADPAKIKAPTLLVYSPTDLVFPRLWIERTASALREIGTPVDVVPLHGPNGHLNGLLRIAQAGPQIADFIVRGLT